MPVPLDWEAKSSIWMTEVIFKKWLLDFNY